jgi:aminoglycoside phosphotransferase (APT) family kinase protein
VESSLVALEAGDRNQVWLDRSRLMVVKVHQDHAAGRNEVAALRAATAAGVPAPRVVAVADEPQRFELTMSYVAGAPVDDDCGYSRFLDLLAPALRALATVVGDQFGRLAGTAVSASWPGYLRDRVLLYSGIVETDPELVTAVESAGRLAEDVAAADLRTAPLLLHHDLAVRHLLITPAGAGVLVDWENAVYGDPLSDIARLAVRLDLIDDSRITALARDVTADWLSHGEIDARLALYHRLHLLTEVMLGAAAPSNEFLRSRARWACGLLESGDRRGRRLIMREGAP